MNTKLGTCTCPHFSFRRTQCKHLRQVAANEGVGGGGSSGGGGGSSGPRSIKATLSAPSKSLSKTGKASKHRPSSGKKSSRKNCGEGGSSSTKGYGEGGGVIRDDDSDNDDDDDDDDVQFVSTKPADDATVGAAEAGEMLSALLDFLTSKGGIATSAELSDKFPHFMRGVQAFCFRALLKDLAVFDSGSGGSGGVWRVRAG